MKLTNRRRRRVASDECGHDSARVRRDHAGEAATIAGVYETFVRTAGTAIEKVARGNLLQILTAGERLRPVDGAGRRLPLRQFVEGSLFNLEEKSSCRFSADAGSGTALCNSWLIIRKAARGSPTARRQSANRRRGAIRGWPSLTSVLRHLRRPRRLADVPLPAQARTRRPVARERALPARS
jgi:hypothetical protein